MIGVLCKIYIEIREDCIMAFKVWTAACCGCGACVETCPVSCITINDGTASINASECLDCGSCGDSCRYGAILQE